MPLSYLFGCATPFYRITFIRRKQPAALLVGQTSAALRSLPHTLIVVSRAGVWQPTRCRFLVSCSCRLTRQANPFIGCVPRWLLLTAPARSCRFHTGRIMLFFAFMLLSGQWSGRAASVSGQAFRICTESALRCSCLLFINCFLAG